jgi:hypothetical protein
MELIDKRQELKASSEIIFSENKWTRFNLLIGDPDICFPKNYF